VDVKRRGELVFMEDGPEAIKDTNVGNPSLFSESSSIA
jgi:hypothetical protein